MLLKWINKLEKLEIFSFILKYLSKLKFRFKSNIKHFCKYKSQAVGIIISVKNFFNNYNSFFTPFDKIIEQNNFSEFSKTKISFIIL